MFLSHVLVESYYIEHMTIAIPLRNNCWCFVFCLSILRIIMMTLNFCAKFHLIGIENGFVSERLHNDDVVVYTVRQDEDDVL